MRVFPPSARIRSIPLHALSMRLSSAAVPQVTMRRAALAIGVGIAQSLSLSGRWRGKDEFELERVRCTAGKLLVSTDSVPLLLCFALRLASPRFALRGAHAFGCCGAHAVWFMVACCASCFACRTA